MNAQGLQRPAPDGYAVIGWAMGAREAALQNARFDLV